MADNTAQNGTATIAADEPTTLNGAASSAVLVQRVKVGYGDDGTYRDASTAFPLPVNIAQSAGSGTATTGTITASAVSTTTGNTSTTGTVVVDVSAAGNVSFHLLTTAFQGTLVFEQSYDPAGGSGTWAAIPVVPEDVTSAPMSSFFLNTAVAYIRQFTQDMFGPALFRVRCSGFTSGSMTVYAKAGPGWYAAQPSLAPSSSVVGHVGLVGGSTGALTTATVGTSASTPLAADANRRGIMVTNTSTTAIVYLGFGAAPTTALYGARLDPGQIWRVDPEFCQVALQAIASAASTVINLNTVVSP